MTRLIVLLCMVALSGLALLMSDSGASADHCGGTPWVIPPDDYDCDGFDRATEDQVGTPWDLDCPVTATANDVDLDAWPVDFDMDQFLSFFDLITFLAPINRMGTSPGDPNFDALDQFGRDGHRWDLVPGPTFPFPTWIALNDLTTLTTGGRDINALQNCLILPRHKLLFTDRWFHEFADTGSWIHYMTLTTHRHYEDPAFAATWETLIDGALADWNSPQSSTNTVFFSELAPDEDHDVHITVTDRFWSHNGLNFDTFNQRGIAYLWDQNLAVGHDCLGTSSPPTVRGGDCDELHSRPNTWWYAFVGLDNDTAATAFRRQGTAAHELGHAIGLSHDFSPYERNSLDGQCANQGLRETLMDSDCMNLGLLNGPQPWDSCGINHKYPDPNWGFQGC